MTLEFTNCLAWYVGAGAAPPEQYCATRDGFEGRLGGLLRAAIGAGLAEDAAQLLTAIAGEVGNNAYDHNLGHWRDQPGCCFGHSTSSGDGVVAWVADRGRGVLGSLARVAPELVTHQQALELAFQKVLSGRHPERRGNGLKFVRAVVNGHEERGLVSVSGDGLLAFGGKTERLRRALGWPQQDGGVLTAIEWSCA